MTPPRPHRPHRPDVKGVVPLEVQHITRECRTDEREWLAWTKAVNELRAVYFAQIGHDPDATISLAVYRTPRGASDA